MYSEDLKRRVLDFIRNGGSKSEASRRYQIGTATIFRWLKQPATHQAGKTGPKGGYKLDWLKLRAMIEVNPDLQQKELAQRLGVSVGAIAHAIRKMGFTRKKRHFVTHKA
jgi:transposase